jgi:RNA polymerase sigma-70 factor (ECF subfamily)
MVTLQGMTYEEVAKATGCDVGTAKTRVFRARNQLRAWLLGDTATCGSAPWRLTAVTHGRDNGMMAASTGTAE